VQRWRYGYEQLRSGKLSDAAATTTNAQPDSRSHTPTNNTQPNSRSHTPTNNAQPNSDPDAIADIAPDRTNTRPWRDPLDTHGRVEWRHVSHRAHRANHRRHVCCASDTTHR